MMTPDREKQETVRLSPPAEDIAGDVTIVIPQENEHCETRTTGTLRNVDREIKSVIFKPDPETVVSGRGEINLCDLKQIYTVDEEIGSGGQAVVYSGVQTALQRDVAVKSLRKEHLNNAARREEFIYEARLTAALDHPAIIPIYNLCSDSDGGLFLSMKKLNGISLKSYLLTTVERYQNSGFENFDEETALANRLDILLKVCQAIEYVHSKKIIHCDLKPENIMLGEFGEVYVMDWGIARKFDRNDNDNGKIMGTPRYTSPENLNGHPCDNRSDIYSLGVILFEIVTLSPAFSGDTAQEIVSKVKNAGFNPLKHRFNTDIPLDLHTIIRKACAADPRERYQTVADFSGDIRNFMRGTEVSTNPDSRFRKLLRWAKRNRRKAAVAALTGGILFTAFIILGIFSANMRQAEIRHFENLAMDKSLAQAVQTAVRIDRMLNHVSTLLGVMNADLAMLLDLNRPSASPMEIVTGEAATQSGEVFHPRTDHRSFFPPGITLNMGKASYINAGNVPETTLKRQLSTLRPAVSRMRRTVLKSHPEMLNLPLSELVRTYQKMKLPISFCYFSLNNGLHVVFPGNNGAGRDFNGITRPWFTSARGHGATPVWGLPYNTVFDNVFPVISCSMEIVGAGEKIHGVSGIDIPLGIIDNVLTGNNDNASFTIKRMLIGTNGEIITACSGSRDGFKADPFTGKTGYFDSKLLAIMRSRRYGRMTGKADGKEILWVFSLIPSTQWFYVEKIALDDMLIFKQAAGQ